MSLEWMVIRGSGIVAFAALAAATIWGLLVSSKVANRWVKVKPLTWFHESLGISALIATVVHVAVLSVHDFLDFSWAEILIPGISDWRGGPIALGVMAMYGLFVIVVSFYVKKHIGQKLWRTIHFGSLGVFVTALLHGITAGSDRTPLMMGLYFGSAVVVAALIALRIAGERETSKAAKADAGGVA